MTSTDRLAEMAAEIERLHARVADSELSVHIWRKAFTDIAQIAQTGTLAKPTPDEPTTITHNIPPSAPPHDE